MIASYTAIMSGVYAAACMQVMDYYKTLRLLHIAINYSTSCHVAACSSYWTGLRQLYMHVHACVKIIRCMYM